MQSYWEAIWAKSREALKFSSLQDEIALINFLYSFYVHCENLGPNSNPLGTLNLTSKMWFRCELGSCDYGVSDGMWLCTKPASF